MAARPLAAIVEKELRSLARRRVTAWSSSWVLLRLMCGCHDSRQPRRPQPHPAHHFLTSSACTRSPCWAVSFWNCFGFDRSAALIYFAAPQPLAKTFVGKNVAALVFIYLEVFILVASPACSA